MRDRYSDGGRYGGGRGDQVGARGSRADDGGSAGGGSNGESRLVIAR
jgi:hypothetical protein